MSDNDHPNKLSEKVAGYLKAKQVEYLPEDLVLCLNTEHFKSALNRYIDHLESCMKSNKTATILNQLLEIPRTPIAQLINMNDGASRARLKNLANAIRHNLKADFSVSKQTATEEQDVKSPPVLDCEDWALLIACQMLVSECKSDQSGTLKAFDHQSERPDALQILKYFIFSTLLLLIIAWLLNYI